MRKARRSRHVEQAGDVAQGHEEKGEDNKFLRGQCHLVGLEGDQSVGLFEKNSQQLGNHQIRNFNQVGNCRYSRGAHSRAHGFGECGLQRFKMR